MRVNDTEAAQRVAEHENLVGELADALEECLKDTKKAIEDHILQFGEYYRPKRLEAWRETVRKANAVLAKAQGVTS